jgi:hypothetical protein
MTAPPPVRLVSPTARQLAASLCMEAPDGWVVTFREDTRSLAQNRAMWSMLADISAQLEWRDWQGRQITMTPEEWKDFLWAAFFREQRMVMGEDGRSFVLVGSGSRTSKLSTAQMSEFLEFGKAFGAQRGVKWTDEERELASLQEYVR